MIQHFIQSETGSAAVDWVVITAAIVGLGLSVMAVISNGMNNIAYEIRSHMAEEE
ncbi:hypothetical protein [Nioella sp.]|jgi:hypothetical protein|uniref:hypothetical protein n=1 Tax=Nioella sp. TaxID=1912091 RepID=UPI003519A8EC